MNALIVILSCNFSFLGDAPMQNHKIFEEYQDYCTISPGVDKRWIVGTEHRQLQIYEPEFETPKAMKTMMVDHLKRRFYIIDADIKVRKKWEKNFRAIFS